MDGRRWPPKNRCSPHAQERARTTRECHGASGIRLDIVRPGMPEPDGSSRWERSFRDSLGSSEDFRQVPIPWSRASTPDDRPRSCGPWRFPAVVEPGWWWAPPAVHPGPSPEGGIPLTQLVGPSPEAQSQSHGPWRPQRWLVNGGVTCDPSVEQLLGIWEYHPAEMRIIV